MARPKGTKYIETPEELEEMFNSYVTEVKGNPFKVKDWVGKDGYEVKREKEKPLTMEGFRVYCYKKYKLTIRQYFDNIDKRYGDYITICTHIKDIVRQDQIEGGMAGIYNPSITQRLNGLTEKIEQTNIEQPLFGRSDDKKC